MSGGAETRSNILPTVEPRGIGFFGPDYNFDEQLIRPAEVGIRRGDSLDSVFNAIKGVGYYMDTIAFGEASSGLTSGMPFKHYGTNYYLNTGSKCSNGADMWHYMELIPKGDSAGVLGTALSEMGYGQLRGLAPGAIEDIKGAVNLGPAAKALFGTGYPVCKLANLPVGDENKQIRNPKSGEPWVDNPNAVKDCVFQNGQWVNVGNYSGVNSTDPSFRVRACQTKWVLDKMVSKKEWDADKKIYNPDGTPMRQSTRESFADFEGIPNSWLLAALVGISIANLVAYKYRYP